MLPKFAATVCSTRMGMMAPVYPSWLSRPRVKGTNTSSATSLVTSMEQKKGSSTRVTPSTRPLSIRRRSCQVSQSKAPRLLKPATTAIRQSSRHSTRQSM